MKILNFGSLNLDHVYSVNHIVRPGETIISSKFSQFLGGKGFNQSIAMSRAGERMVYHAGCIGMDGKSLVDVLETEKVNTQYIEMKNSSTGKAIIQLDSTGQNSIVLFGGANQTIDEKQIDFVLSGFNAGDILVIQNEISSLHYLINRAFEKQMFIILNPSPITKELFKYPLKNVSLFIMNEIEGEEITQESSIGKMFGKVRTMFQESSVLITFGSAGSAYWDAKQEKLYTGGIFDLPVIDTTAAGDTFTGYFVSALAQGKGPEQALLLATKASSVAVNRVGASSSIPFIGELDDILSAYKYKLFKEVIV